MAEFYQGSDVSFDVVVTVDGQPLPAINAAVYTVYDRGSSNPLAVSTLADGGITYSNGTVTINLTETQTALLSGTLKHDCMVRTTTGRDIAILSEQVRFLPMVSRITP